jgi:hypothetical protein
MHFLPTRTLLLTLLAVFGGAIAQTPPDSAAAPAGGQKPAKPAVTHDALKDGLVVVGPPKIYDDLYLRTLLNSLQAQLASIHAVDQSTLLSHIGVAQGADTRQMSVAVSGSGPSTPQTSTFTLAPGVPAFSYPPGYTTPPDTGVTLPTGTAAATTPGTTSTVNSVTPTAPTPTAPPLSSPTISSLGQSSLDTYNESLQLSAEITNTALLLNGALSDSLQVNGQPKTTVTIGFPVTVDAPAPADKDKSGAVAEVHVSVCTASTDEPPSIVTLLPQERTYNVASLVSKSFLGSVSAVLGGVLNVGGGFLWSHQRYFLVQQQETVAFLDTPAPSPCGGEKATAFVWQVRPVLGKNFIRPGNSVNFVQISIPQVVGASATTSIGQACVSVVWRKPSVMGIFGKKSEDYLDEGKASEQKCYEIEYYRTLIDKTTLRVTDIGQGAVTVKVGGTFLSGTTVRLGNTYLNPDSVTATHDTLTFTAPASAIAAAGQVYIVGRDGREIAAVNQLAQLPASGVSITPPLIAPYSDTQSMVSFTFTPPSFPNNGDNSPGYQNPADDPWVVVLGGKVFGMSDAPFFSSKDCKIKIIVPTALIQSSPRIEFRRLLWPDVNFRTATDIPADSYSKASSSVSKISILSSSNGLTLALIGTGLDNLKLVYPPDKICNKCEVTAVGSTYLQVTLPKPEVKKDSAAADASKTPPPDPTDGLRQLVFCRKNGDNCDPSYPALLVDVPKLDAPTPKPSLDKHDPVPANAQPVTVNITGTMLDSVVSIEHGKLPLTFRLSAGPKPSLAVDLPTSIISVPGGYSLLITFADKSTDAYLLTVKNPAQ